MFPLLKGGREQFYLVLTGDAKGLGPTILPFRSPLLPVIISPCRFEKLLRPKSLFMNKGPYPLEQLTIGRRELADIAVRRLSKWSNIKHV